MRFISFIVLLQVFLACIASASAVGPLAKNYDLPKWRARKKPRPERQVVRLDRALSIDTRVKGFQLWHATYLSRDVTMKIFFIGGSPTWPESFRSECLKWFKIGKLIGIGPSEPRNFVFMVMDNRVPKRPTPSYILSAIAGVLELESSRGRTVKDGGALYDNPQDLTWSIDDKQSRWIVELIDFESSKNPDNSKLQSAISSLVDTPYIHHQLGYILKPPPQFSVRGREFRLLFLCPQPEEHPPQS